MRSSYLLVLIAVLLSGCQGPYRVTPEMLREQTATHSTREDPRERIDHIVCSSDQMISFDEKGAYFDPSQNCIAGRIDNGPDTTIALSQLKAAYLVRQDATAQAASGFGWVVTAAFIALMVLASMFGRISTI